MKTEFGSKDYVCAYQHEYEASLNRREMKRRKYQGKPPTGKGAANRYSLEGLVQAAVWSELSILGIFGVQHKTSVLFIDPSYNDQGVPIYTYHRGLGTDPYFFVPGYLKRYDYSVVVTVSIRHDYLPGANIPKKARTGPGTYYHVVYEPEEFEGERCIDKWSVNGNTEMTELLRGRESKTNT